MDCLPITGAMDLASCRVMPSSLISSLFPAPGFGGFKTRKRASGKANIAIANVTKLKPD